jgi:hypothetical protein
VKSRALDEGNHGKPKEVVNLLEQPNYLVEEKYPTPIESPRIFSWPPFLPVCLPYTCLSGKLFSILPVAPASVHYTLIRQIAALGYSVTGFPLPHTNLSPLPPGVWHCAVVLGDFIFFIVAPTAASLSDSSSDQSAYGLPPTTSPTRITSIRISLKTVTGAPSSWHFGMDESAMRAPALSALKAAQASLTEGLTRLRVASTARPPPLSVGEGESLAQSVGALPGERGEATGGGLLSSLFFPGGLGSGVSSRGNTILPSAGTGDSFTVIRGLEDQVTSPLSSAHGEPFEGRYGMLRGEPSRGFFLLAGSETYAHYGSGTLKIWRGMASKTLETS